MSETESDHSETTTPAPTQGMDLELPHDLPPVEPPSAGMIFQLFLVPAIIVTVIIGVYAAFGKLASQELDWRQLVTDVKSENPHVRWRGALGLAQMLDADAQRGDRSQNLKANPEIASALANLYSSFIDLQNLTEEELKNLEFLSKALGRMTSQDEILPVFEEGIAENRDHEVRKHSLIGLTMFIGSVQGIGAEIQDPKLVDDLIDVSKESELLFRHQGAYALGLFDTESAHGRLVELLNDPDQMTRVNAAVGLARQGSSEGHGVFLSLIEQGISWQLDPSQVKTEEQESEYFVRMLMLSNGLKAIGQLKDQFDPSMKQHFVEELDRLQKGTKDNVLKSQAIEVREDLKT